MSLRDNTFLIACPARSGSTMLVRLLQSHPDIWANGEVFVGRNGREIGALAGVYGKKIREEKGAKDSLVKELRKEPIKFFYKYVLDAQGKKVSGFKLKSDELIKRNYAFLKDIVSKDKDIKIIHLNRRNLLKRYLSWCVVNKMTGVTLVTNEQEAPDVKKIRLDPKECLKDFEMAEKREIFLRDLFKDHRSIDVEYENLVSSPDEWHFKLCDFLGVSKKRLTTSTKKIISNKLSDSIENYEELYSFFKNTKYGCFFD